LVAIRPEDLQLQPDDGSKTTNLLRCSVENVLYLGRDCELVLSFGGHMWTFTVPRSSATGIGQSVALYLPGEHLRVWAADGAPVEGETVNQKEALEKPASSLAKELS
jgi:hypothetical protein